MCGNIEYNAHARQSIVLFIHKYIHSIHPEMTESRTARGLADTSPPCSITDDKPQAFPGYRPPHTAQDLCPYIAVDHRSHGHFVILANHNPFKQQYELAKEMCRLYFSYEHYGQ